MNLLLRQNLYKVLLSLFIVFHVLTIFICPNPDGILFRKFSSTIVEYGNLFGLNTTWRFFSPNPAVRLIEYDVFKKDQDGQYQSESFRYPKKVDDEKFHETYNRKINNGMYVVGRGIVNETLGPALCRAHPGAQTIALYSKGRIFPSIEKAKLQGEHVAEIGEVRRDYLMDVHCGDHETAH